MSQCTEADAVLLSLRKRRSSPACYPCSKRKVRCRGGRPCDACREKGHPEICHVDSIHKPRRKAAAAPTSAGSTTSSRPRGISSPALTPSSPATNASRCTPRALADIRTEPSVGRFSAINFVRERLSGASKMLGSDIHASIGLGNTDNRPLAVAPLNVPPSDSASPPSRLEVLRFYPPFRNNVVVLYPFVYDVTAFDTQVYGMLKGDFSEPQRVAVVLASLALGAQFAEVVGQPRREISRDFISRSTAFLQQANYVFQPSLEVVQALLMIGMALQNSGQSDAAWTLLGLNYRLAQTLGIHRLDPNDGNAAMLWTAIIWQDALISLRYDRPPLSYGMGVGDLEQSTNLSYFQAIRSCCLIALDMLQASSTQRTSMSYVQRSIDALDDTLTRCCPHLQTHDQPRTFEQHLQRHALKLHSSLVLAEICRPVFSMQDPHDSVIGEIRQRGLNALIGNVEAYLEICTFSNVPLRLWSMTQAAVSCALILALITQEDSKSALRPMLGKLVDALRMSTDSQDPITNLPVQALHGVCLMRVKSTTLLESILAGITESTVAKGQEEPLALPEMAFDTVDMTWPTELSLFDQAFAKSILTFDPDQDVSFNNLL